MVGIVFHLYVGLIICVNFKNYYVNIPSKQNKGEVSKSVADSGSREI